MKMKILMTFLFLCVSLFASAQWRETDWRDASGLVHQSFKRCAFADMGEYMGFFVEYEGTEYTFFAKGIDKEEVEKMLKARDSREFNKFIISAVLEKGRYLTKSVGNKHYLWVASDRTPVVWRYREGVGANSYFEFIKNNLEMEIEDSYECYYFPYKLRPRNAVTGRTPQTSPTNTTATNEVNSRRKLDILDLLNALCPGAITEYDRKLWDMIPKRSSSGGGDSGPSTMWDSYNSAQQAVIHEYDNAK